MWRKQGGQYYVIFGAQLRFRSEGTSFDVVWAPFLKLLTKGLPEPRPFKPFKSKDAKNPYCCESGKLYLLIC